MERKRGSLPVGSVVRLKKTNEFCLITEWCCLKNQPENFLHYMMKIEGRGDGGVWVGYDEEVELECLPPDRAENLNKNI